MKKFLLALLTMTVALCAAVATACGGGEPNEMAFKTLTVNDNVVTTTVSNATESFDFGAVIELKGKAGFVVSTDAAA